MNKNPVNYLLTIAIIAVLWVVFAILLGATLSEGPNLSEKDPTELASLLRLIFGCGALTSIFSCCYWYYYGNLEKTAGELKKAKTRWNVLFITGIVAAVILTVIIILLNLTQGIQASWYAIYFGINALLTFIAFWITTYLMSPNIVKFIPIGR